MLRTKLQHIETDEEYQELLRANSKVMLCCGRMGPMCIPVYAAMEKLQHQYPGIAFRDMDFDIPVAKNIKKLPECASFSGLPFTVYFKNGKVVSATTSIQPEPRIREILDRIFGEAQ